MLCRRLNDFLASLVTIEMNELPVIGSLCLRDDLSRERIWILVFAQTFLGSPRGKHYNSPESRLFGRRNNLSPYIASQQVATFVAWRSQKSWRKHKDPDPFARKVISRPPGKTNRFNEAKKHHPKKQRTRSGFPLHQNFLLEISVVRPVSQISRTATSLFGHFMKTPISRCFGICDKFIFIVRCNSRCQRKMHIKIADENPWKNLNTLQENSGLSHLSRFGFSKLFGFSRIPHSNKYFVFFFPQTKLR